MDREFRELKKNSRKILILLWKNPELCLIPIPPKGYKKIQAMNCWHCSTELIWGGDHDLEEEEEDYCMSTNLS